jgi:hypothetical protein
MAIAPQLRAKKPETICRISMADVNMVIHLIVLQAKNSGERDTIQVNGTKTVIVG